MTLSSASRYPALLLLLALLAVYSAPLPAEGLLRRDYESFTLWLDCERRGAVRFEYTVAADSGNYPRERRFHLDPQLPAECQQGSSASYRHPGQRYDRGHLVPANHMDHDPQAIHESNYMSNILPQAANMNRGAWLLTEEITECYRDRGEVRVIGGVIWGEDSSDDYFIDSHRVATPEGYWKLLLHQGRWIAWLIPNSPEATRSHLDDYLVGLEALQEKVGETLNLREVIPVGVPAPARSWALPSECDRS